MWRVLLGGGGFRIRVHQPPNMSILVADVHVLIRVITSSGNVVALSKIIMVIKNKKVRH